jgi:hypothetical protein
LREVLVFRFQVFLIQITSFYSKGFQQYKKLEGTLPEWVQLVSEKDSQKNLLGNESTDSENEDTEAGSVLKDKDGITSQHRSNLSETNDNFF